MNQLELLMIAKSLELFTESIFLMSFAAALAAFTYMMVREH
jgi:hypothetical protein